MEGYSRLYRRWVIGLIVAAVWYFSFYGIDPVGYNSNLVRGLNLVLAIALAVGVIPGLYIDSLLAKISLRAIPSLTIAFAVILPIIFLVLTLRSLYVTVYTWDMLHLTAVARYGLLFDGVMSLILLACLLVNLFTIARILLPSARRRQ
jgi:hypothetical protein